MLIYFTRNAMGTFLSLRLLYRHSIIIVSGNYNQSHSSHSFNYMYYMHITKLKITNIREEIIVPPFQKTLEQEAEHSVPNFPVV